MKTKKSVILSAGLTFAAALFLLFVWSIRVQIQKTYSSSFSGNPTTFNYLLDYYADNTAIITNLVDGLLENDNHGNLVPSLLRRLVCFKRRSNLYLQIEKRCQMVHS